MSLSEDRFDAAIREFEFAVRQFSGRAGSMGADYGRGTSPLPRRGLRGKDVLPKEELDKLKKELEGLNLTLSLNRKLEDVDRKRKKELEKQLKDLEDSAADNVDSYKDLKRSLKTFGSSLAFGETTASRAFSSLGNSLQNSTTSWIKTLGGFAGGVGFMVQAMEGFAKDAREMGGFADLDAFKLGSIQQAKLMSGLGDSFIKVIDASQGGFRAFGRSSQEAVERLSELSRGFRVGSSKISSELAANLGPELTKTIDKARNSTAAMGLTAEDQAAVMGSLSQVIGLTAKSEKEAQQMMVRQYAETVESARNLSNTFGVSAKEMLKSMETFRKSIGGKAAALAGQSKEAANLFVTGQKLFGDAIGENELARMSAMVATGDESQIARAQRLLKDNPDLMATFDLFAEHARRARAMEGGLAKGENIDTALRSLIPEIQNLADLRRGNLDIASYGDTSVTLDSVLASMKRGEGVLKGDQEAKEKKGFLGIFGGKKETDAIKAENTLTDALNSLRWAVIALTAGIFKMGMFGGIGTGGIIGGILTGGAGGVGGVFKKIGGALGKIPGMDKLGKIFTGGKGGSIFDKISEKSGKSGKGMGTLADMLKSLGDTKTLKGAGTLALLGAALALAAHGFKTFGEVKWEGIGFGLLGIGALIAMARGVAEAKRKVLNGAGVIVALSAALLLSAYGFKAFNNVEWTSLVKGGLAIGALTGIAYGLSFAADKFKRLKWGDLFKTVAVITILSGTLLMLSYVLKKFDDVSAESVGKAVVAIGALSGIATGIAFAADKFKSLDWGAIFKAAAVITILGLSLYIAAPGFKAFNEIEWSSLFKAAGAIGILAVAIWGLGTLMQGGAMGGMLAGIATLMAIGVAAAVVGWGVGVFAKSLKVMSEIDGANLMLVGAGLAAIGLSMGIFAFGMLAGTASGVISGIASLFGVKSPLDKVKEFVPMADKIAMIGEGIKNFGTGILTINRGVSEFNKDAFSTLKTSMQEFAVVGSSEEMRLTAEYLKTIGTSLGNISQIKELPSSSILGNISNSFALGGQNAAGAAPIMTQEMIAIMMEHLSSIQNDIAAIRGNTRPGNPVSVVRGL